MCSHLLFDGVGSVVMLLRWWFWQYLSLMHDSTSYGYVWLSYLMGYRTGVGKVPHQMAVWKILCLHDVFGGMLNVNQSSLRRATN